MRVFAALGAGVALWLAAPAPAAADFFGWPNQAGYYSNVWPPREDKPLRKQRHNHEPESARQTVREQHPQGPFQIVVEIAKQEVELYGQNGFVARAPISTGMPGHPTPLGVFTVLSKAKWHQSNIYSGAPMPYMQRITWSGVAMHAGPRPGYPASHGCIRLPEDFAIWLFHTTKVGARVIVTREPAPPVDIDNPKLFVPATLAGDTTKVATSAPAAPAAAIQPVAAVTVADATDKIAPAAEQKPSAPPRPITVFVSRKQSKVFVRQGFNQLFDMPVTIADADRPLGTHIYTAMALKDEGKALRWNVISIPSGYAHHKAKRRGKTEDAEAEPQAASTAAEALDRIALPPEAIEKISMLISPGSSLIVSDNPLSDETDADTDLIVLTP
ncbi:MAG TPA: L,D-transpeptidase [Pseudolabrys sp.]|nr:L,D-transpeptidase [Pseudolabrys sp.]